jgi:hypothetical protein
MMTLPIKSCRPFYMLAFLTGGDLAAGAKGKETSFQI